MNETDLFQNKTVSESSWGDWDWNKASRAVVAKGHIGCLLWYVGGHISFEIEEVGLYYLDLLGLDSAPPGISIWEGIYEPETDYFGDTITHPNGEFRPPTEEEWEAIRKGNCPWNPSEWKKEPESPLSEVGR